MRVFSLIAQKYGIQLLVLAAVLVVLMVTTPTLMGASTIYATFEHLSLLGLVAGGLAVTMICRELDMSVGSMAVLSGVIAIQLGDYGIWLSLLIATLCGISLGLLQGFLIAKLGINSLVFTVGTLILFSGAAWLLAGGGPVTLTNFQATDVLLQRIGVFSPASLLAIVVLVLLGIFLSQSRWGRELYAIGGSRNEAIAAGVPAKRTLTIAFAISGGTAAMAGALTSLKGASVTPDSFSALLLTAVAACLIGGVSLYGGRGNIINVTLGVVILAVLSSGLAARGEASFMTELLTGILLFVVLLVDYLTTRAKRSRKMNVSEDKIRVEAMV